MFGEIIILVNYIGTYNNYVGVPYGVSYKTIQFSKLTQTNKLHINNTYQIFSKFVPSLIIK